jgi:hypothetical protein
VLEGRLERLLDRYLTRLSPLDEVHLEGEAVCALDLARKRQVRPANAFHYDARLEGGGGLSTTTREDGSVCIALPRATKGERDPADAVIVSVTNGVAPGSLQVHFHDLGPGRGYYLAGLERTAGAR